MFNFFKKTNKEESLLGKSAKINKHLYGKSVFSMTQRGFLDYIKRKDLFWEDRLHSIESSNNCFDVSIITAVVGEIHVIVYDEDNKRCFDKKFYKKNLAWDTLNKFIDSVRLHSPPHGLIKINNELYLMASRFDNEKELWESVKKLKDDGYLAGMDYTFKN